MQRDVCINPIRLANLGQSVAGEVKLDQLTQLCVELLETSGTVKYQFMGGVDRQGLRYLHGRVTASLVLTCQRCGMRLDYDIDAKSQLSPVISIEQARELPEHYEPLMVDGLAVSVSNIVEEELLLNLPMVPRHSSGQCPVSLPEYLN